MEKNSEKLLQAILTIVLGVLFIVFKNDIIGITMTILGIALIISAIIDLVHKQVAPCVIKAVVGVVIIVFGWTLMSAALYIMAALLLIYGILLLYQMIKENKERIENADKALGFIKPILYIVSAVCLLFNQGGTIEWVFILSGLFFVVEGIISLVQYFKGLDA